MINSLKITEKELKNDERRKYDVQKCNRERT